MPKIVIFLITILAIIIIAVAIWIFSGSSPFPGPELTGQNPGSLTQKANEVTPQEQMAQIKKDYPLAVKGVINFLSAGKTNKATVKADDGKEYTLWPPQPASIYSSYGVKSGQKIEIQGKINSQGNLEWGAIKPI